MLAKTSRKYVPYQWEKKKKKEAGCNTVVTQSSFVFGSLGLHGIVQPFP